MTIKVAIVLVDQHLASASAGAIDLFHSANLAWQHLHPNDSALFIWEVVSEDGKPVTASNGYSQVVDGNWHRLTSTDLVFLPGVSVISEAVLLDIVGRNQSLLSWLQQQAVNNTVMASSCTGSFFFAEAGLLSGKKATTAWSFTSLFARSYADIELQSDALLVDNGSILCSGTATSYQDLVLVLIQRFAGREVALLVSRYMLVEYNRSSQAAFRVPIEQDYDDPLVVAAIEYIRVNMHKQLSVETLASKMNVSCRTLIRHFQNTLGDNPNAFIQKQRIESAKRLMEVTGLPLDDIVHRVGYTDISAFRRLFKRNTEMTPKAYRERFGVCK